MTHSELFKLHELKGRLQGRATCLESDVRATGMLVSRLKTERCRAHYTGRLETLQQWRRDNIRLLEEVERIIKEAENARE